MPVNSEGATIEGIGTLRYTLGAAKSINANFGDFTTAYNRVGKVDFSAIVSVVAAGLGKDVDKVEDRVFKAGPVKIAGEVSQFLAWLSNGGRDPSIKPPTQDEEPDSKNE